MTRRYETVYIFDSALEEPAINEKLERFHALVTKDAKGTKVKPRVLTLRTLRPWREALRGGNKIEMPLHRRILSHPDFAAGWINAGMTFKAAGQLVQAEACYRQAIGLDDPRNVALAHFNLANTFLEGDKFGDAVAHYRAALKARPNWPEAQQGLALAEAGVIFLGGARCQGSCGRGPSLSAS